MSRRTTKIDVDDHRRRAGTGTRKIPRPSKGAAPTGRKDKRRLVRACNLRLSHMQT